MTRERLAQILSAYGARPEHWPQEERAAALALLAQSEEAQRHAREQDGLDRLLDRFAVPHPHSASIGRALAAFPKASPAALLWKWWVGALLAGAGAVGMIVGAVMTPALLDRRSAGWIDEQPTIFSPVDVEDLSL